MISRGRRSSTENAVRRNHSMRKHIMKKILLAILVCLSGHVSPVCAAEHQILRDSSGKIVGTIVHNGGSIILLDRRGKVEESLYR